VDTRPNILPSDYKLLDHVRIAVHIEDSKYRTEKTYVQCIRDSFFLTLSALSDLAHGWPL